MNQKKAVDSKGIADRDQIAIVEASIDASLATDEPALFAIKGMVSEWQYGSLDLPDVGVLISSVDKVIAKLEAFRANVVAGIEAAPRVNLVDQLVEEALNSRISQDLLDEAVYETCGDGSAVRANEREAGAEGEIKQGEALASDINNQGPEAQIRFLAETLGVEVARSVLAPSLKRKSRLGV